MLFVPGILKKNKIK